MRKLAILLLLAGTASPAFAANPVTVDMVDQLLIYAHGKSDAKVAEELFDLELTERVSSARLQRWEAELPGPKSRQAMVALADASVFLRLPPDEIPGSPALGRDAQDSLLTLSRTYIEDTIPKLPNFFATRNTTLFSDEPLTINTITMSNSPYKQMHLVGTSSDKAYFREGKEVIISNTDKHASPSPKGLYTQGVFGEAIELVLSDILPSGPVWSHWEGGPDNPLAVFRYTVPREKSHYTVNVNDDPRSNPPSVAYHGEIAIDPADGTIRRLTAVAELNANSPMSKADVMVQYGPVEIGGASYICPIRSVSFGVVRTFNSAPSFQSRYGPATTMPGPSVTKVNDVQFTEYHRFRAETRILTGDAATPDAPPPASGSALNPPPNQ
ncbi:exported hypothetical protein [Candidatus Sulfotelmatomonas gaucii]|uniref:Uncharacterized protein n=1 Tax=Candidatus Sulfuritelmatomonas gaucii TaxID=2043161 RepID=A0A2N9LLQ6_9BACT|nr:exported hypothetical protein [Candidatus Sulfotelmatomonas gaucii]